MLKKIVILVISAIAFILLTLAMRNSYFEKQSVKIKEIHDKYETFNLTIDSLIHEEEYDQAIEYIDKTYKHMNIYTFNTYPELVWQTLSKLGDTPDGVHLLRQYIDEILQNTKLEIDSKVFFLNKMETLCMLEMDYFLATEYIVEILCAEDFIDHDYYKGKVLVDLATIAKNLDSSEISIEILESINSQISPIDDPLKAADLEMYRLINLAQSKNNVGKHEDALKDLQKASEYMSMIPTSTREEIKYLIKIGEAQIHISTGNLEKGQETLSSIYPEDILEQIRSYSSTYIDYLIAVGDLYLSFGNYEEAKSIYKYVIDNDFLGTEYISKKSTLLNLSIIEENLGNYEESEKLKSEVEKTEKCWNAFKMEMLYKYVSSSKEAKTIITANSKMKVANFIYFFGLIIAILIILKTVTIPRYRIKIKRNLVMQNMKDGNYFLVYQPIVNPRNNETTGVETLLRLRNQNRVLSPNSFMKDIEISEMMDQIALWQLKEIKRTYEDIQRIPNKSSSFYISINISLNEVKNKNFIKEIKEEGADLIKNGSLICLEITETVGITDENLVKLHISELIEAGFKIAIDDFGIEYSNISMLDQFDFHTLKLDKYFIDHMMDSVVVKSLFKVVNDISKELNINVVVEGVEEQWQLDILLNYSTCPIYIQGYYFSRPLEVHQLKDFTPV